MKLYSLSLVIMFLSIATLEASFGIGTPISTKEGLKDKGIEMTYWPRDNPDGTKSHQITLQVLAAQKTSHGYALHRVDYWRKDRSTEIPIAMRESGMGIKRVDFTICDADLDDSYIVIRYWLPNTSSEHGDKLNLKELIKEFEQDRRDNG